MEPVDISAPSLQAVKSRLTGALALVPTAAVSAACVDAMRG